VWNDIKFQPLFEKHAWDILPDNEFVAYRSRRTPCFFVNDTVKYSNLVIDIVTNEPRPS